MAGIPLIVLLAITLLIYWFRYACQLVVNARIEPDYIARVSAANGLSFLLVRSQLQRGEGSLDALRDALDTDYELLLYLLRHSRGADGEAVQDSLEQSLLRWDYLMLGFLYWCKRDFFPAQARKVLEERSRILTWLAHEAGRTIAGDLIPTGHATIMTWHPKRRSSQQSTDSIKFAVK